ncbi:hypothetical protein [Hymenobacter convexus]|uniref:hypothetical protein n=1 Tax=Hymenobacter sp. CA1UV-4 TaxID=3063782 RepID=UPI00271359DC|nr:hypothetical protein [Hymenobacter sp. CA1UV-4]MDO7850648.1 hypothetical protein [Hymenobacter sp. CA1UV-4]
MSKHGLPVSMLTVARARSFPGWQTTADTWSVMATACPARVLASTWERALLPRNVALPAHHFVHPLAHGHRVGHLRLTGPEGNQ